MNTRIPRRARLEGTPFANRISYSSPNEDARSEIRALNIQPTDTVLCVTAAGDRVLSLIGEGPRKLIAIDFNPNQNHLLRLKCAAIRQLERADFLGFVGIAPTSRRLEIYAQLRAQLPLDCLGFWDRNLDRIERGVFFDGSFERHFRAFSTIVRALRPRMTRTLLAFVDLSEQRKFVEQKWDTPGWKRLMGLLMHERLFQFLLEDPGFYQYVPREVSVSEYLVERMSQCLREQLASDNFFVRFVLTGRYDPSGPLPDYLSQAGYERVKQGLESSELEILSRGLGDYLSGCEAQSIDKFSLSDVSGYLEADHYASLLRSVHRAGTADGVACLRQLVTKRPIPPSCAALFDVDHAMAASLRETDQTFVYDFTVARVSPSNPAGSCCAGS